MSRLAGGDGLVEGGEFGRLPGVVGPVQAIGTRAAPSATAARALSSDASQVSTSTRVPKT